MTTTIYGGGRLGNQIIRNIAVSIIAEKYNLCANYSSNDLINNLGIKLFNGSNVYSTTQALHNDNYFDIYNCGNLTFNLDANHDFFQTKDITRFVYNYLHSEKIKTNIIEKNPFKPRYNSNNDLFIHIRLTDVAKINPGIDYYVNTINKIQFDNLYISTDEQTHTIVTTLLQLYPSAKIIDYDEINTFQYASTCKNIILSHGTFSAVIGYLSFFSNIYYPEFLPEKLWHGDVFSINGWIECSLRS